MGIPSTTPAAIRAALVPLIEALTPSNTEYQVDGWRHVERGEAVGGPAIRTFKIIHGLPREDFEGIHSGGGVEYAYEMRIRTAYGGLDPEEAIDVAGEDAADLMILLHPLGGSGASAIPGLLSFRGPIEPEELIDEDGHLLVDFVTEVHYKREDS